MSCHVLRNAAGEIDMWDAQPFPGSVEVDYEVVRGWDGRPYKAGEEPLRPAEAIFEVLRASRDMRLAATDKYVLADYPISEGYLAQVKAYRPPCAPCPNSPVRRGMAAEKLPPGRILLTFCGRNSHAHSPAKLYRRRDIAHALGPV